MHRARTVHDNQATGRLAIPCAACVALAAAACGGNAVVNRCELIVEVTTPGAGALLVGEVGVRLRDSTCRSESKPASAVLGATTATLQPTADGFVAGTLDTTVAGPDGPVDLMVSVEDRAGTVHSATVPVELANHYYVSAAASSLTVAVGADVTVTCTLHQADGTEVAGHTFQVEITGPVASREDLPGGVRFQPTRIGSLAVLCSTHDGQFTQLAPTEITVVPGTLGSVDTRLAAPSFVAGEAGSASCVMADDAGNVIPEPGPFVSVIQSPLNHTAAGDGSHLLEGTVTGTYPVACAADLIVDPSPETVEITPAPPASVDTNAPSTGAAGDSVIVICDARDTYGNQVPDAATSITVVHTGGLDATATGLVIAGETFVVTLAGEYDARCSVSGAGIADPSAHTVQVGPGLPATLAASLINPHCVGGRLVVSTQVEDAYGNTISAATLALSASADDLFTDNGDGTIIINKTIPFDLTVSVAGATHAGQRVDPVVLTVQPDIMPPQVVVNEPLRAAILTSGSAADTTVPVTGTAVDAAYDVVDLLVNDAAVSVAGDGSFSTTVDSRWGMSIIRTQATDTCGNSGGTVRAFLRSPTYFAPATVIDAAATVPQGLVIRFAAEAIDDGDRTDIDDVATAMMPLLAAFDANTAMPPGTVLVDTSLYTVTRSSAPISAGGPDVVSLAAVGGGIELVWRLRDLWIPLDATLELLSISASAVVRATSMEVTTIIGVSQSPSGPQTSHFSTSTSYTGLNVTCDGVVDAICTVFRTSLNDQARTALDGAALSIGVDEITPAMQAFLDDLPFTSSLALGDPVNRTLTMSSILEDAVLCGANVGLPLRPECPASGPPQGYLDLVLGVQTLPTGRDPSIPAGTPGAIRNDATLPGINLLVGDTIGLARADATLNQALWAVWYDGGLTGVPFNAVGSAGDVTFTLNFGLPPVFMPGRTGYDLDLGIGDVEVLVAFNGVPVTNARLSTIMGVDLQLGATSGTVEVVPEAAPDVFVELTQSNFAAVQEDQIITAIRDIAQSALPALVIQLLSGTSMPTVPIDGITGVPGQAWIITAPTPSYDAGYYVVSGILAESCGGACGFPSGAPCAADGQCASSSCSNCDPYGLSCVCL